MSGVSVYPTPVLSTIATGTTSVQDLDNESTNDNILEELKKITLHLSLLTDTHITSREV